MIHIEPKLSKTARHERVLNRVIHREDGVPDVRETYTLGERKEDVEDLPCDFLFGVAYDGCVTVVVELPQYPERGLCADLLKPKDRFIGMDMGSRYGRETYTLSSW